jgi:short-subunit dehydrogenase
MLYAASRAGTDLALRSSQGIPKLDLTDAFEHRASSQDNRKRAWRCRCSVQCCGTQHYKTTDRSQIMDVKYQGALHMRTTFLSTMKPGSRIVNPSSVASSLQSYDEELQARFANSKKTISDLQQLVEECKVGKASVGFHEADCLQEGIGSSWSRCTRWVAT